MQIKLTPITQVHPFPKNPRAHSKEQITRIAKSIKEFGFNQPIVIDEESTVLVGHGRLEAAKSLKLKDIPVVQLMGLTEDKKRAYRILDNKLQNDSTWDFNTLEEELSLLESNGFELEPWGLDDLKNLLTSEETSSNIKDLSNDLDSSYKIEISCMSELHQKELYEKFTKDGLLCRILTL